MKRIMLIILIAISLSSVFAQATQLILDVNGLRSFYNSIKASSFDVENPANQPLMFTVLITKTDPNTQFTQDLSVNVTLKWNGDNLISNVNVPFKEQKINILNNPGGSLFFNNQNVLIENGNEFFDEPDGEISLDQLTSNNAFKDALLNTGYLPDGTYEFILQIVRPTNAVSNQATFSFTVQNVNNISLIGPGAPAGQNIVEAFGQSIIYSWITNSINPDNKYSIEIREYMQPQTMDMTNLAYTGRAFYSQSDITIPIFNQNLPYIENNYYAWRVKLPLITNLTDNNVNTFVESQWFVFKYVSSPSAPNAYQEIINILQNIQNPLLMDIVAQGYLPTGNFWFNGNEITPDQLQEILLQILNSQNYSVEIID